MHVVGQNEISLSLNLTYSLIMNNWGEKTKEIENQASLKLFLPEFIFDLQHTC